MIGRALTRHYRLALGALLLVLALVVGELAGPAESAPVVWYSSVIHVPSDPSTGSGWPARIGTLAVVDGQSNVWIKTGTGATAWASASGGAASIAITSGTPGNVNESTLGTLDWLYVEAWGANRFTWHSKAKGGWLLNSFDYLSPQTATSTDSRAWTNFSTFADDTNTNGLQSVTRSFNGYNGTNAVNSGWHFRLPSDGTQHQVFWQGTGFNANTLVTAYLSCGLASPQTLTFNTVASSGMDYRAVVTWTAPRGCDLVIQHQVTLCIGGTACNLYIGPIIAS